MQRDVTNQAKDEKNKAHLNQQPVKRIWTETLCREQAGKGAVL